VNNNLSLIGATVIKSTTAYSTNRWRSAKENETAKTFNQKYIEE
jgi:hypothetical protein